MIINDLVIYWVYNAGQKKHNFELGNSCGALVEGGVNFEHIAQYFQGNFKHLLKL